MLVMDSAHSASDIWTIRESAFDPARQYHKETIFTIGNGYLCTRGAFEEGYPDDRRATFIHGVFDAAPKVVTELANVPDWLPLVVYVNGERVALDRGSVEAFERTLDLRNGVLRRVLRWRSPSGDVATLTFERFASLADEHLVYLRCRVMPEFAGRLEFHAALDGRMDNEGLMHWQWLAQGERDGAVYLHNRTRQSQIETAYAMRVHVRGGERSRVFWEARDRPTIALQVEARTNEEIILDKAVSLFTSRDQPRQPLIEHAVERVQHSDDWEHAYTANTRSWQAQWHDCDVVIEGDDEAQLAMRFNLFQLLIAAPCRDEHVSIGAKTLSGFGYRGHAFWDTEIFMLPLFTFTAPRIAQNLLNYRFHNLAGARRKARAHGYEGAQFPWESADSGDEVTPTWLPHFADRTQLVRIWTGDIEIHISADIAYAAYQYWQVTGDDVWFITRGAELILDTAKYWASRAEWNADAHRYEYNDVIGPDEYHDHVNNNFFTNYMARWNLDTALHVLDWLHARAPHKADELVAHLDLKPARLAHWRDVIHKLYLPVKPNGLIEQFEGYFQRRDVELAALEPRTRSVQALFGIEGANETQVIKQPDVLMLMCLLPDHFTPAHVRVNYDYYTPRTDHTFGSSLGPSIQTIMACEVGKPDEAYDHFIRAVRADLRDVRGNADDGIHGASAAGTWQAIVFGFGGLKLTAQGWTTQPRLPQHWKRLRFNFFYRGERQQLVLQPTGLVRHSVENQNTKPVRGFIFDLDGVLTDTAEYHYRAWQRLADEEGMPFTREANEALRGVARRDSLRLILKDRIYPEEKMVEMMERKNRYYLEWIEQISPRDLLPGALELLVEIRSAGLKTALGSASRNAYAVVERLGIATWFDAIADGGSVERQKPAPDLFIHAAALLGLTPDVYVVVEDAAAGIEAAKAGGFRTVGLGPSSRVGRADAVFPSLASVHLSDVLHALNAQIARE